MAGPFNPKFWENNSFPPSLLWVALIIQSFGAYRFFVDFENYEAAKVFSI